MAEHRLESLSVQLDQLPGSKHDLEFDLVLSRRHLDILVLEGADLCFPASVVEARQRENRIARELQGDLTMDASNDLIVQRERLARLERRLDYVIKQQVCKIQPVAEQHNPKEFQTQSEDIGKHIYDLLNSDNQFAYDSAELNPKYTIRLARAAKLLTDQPAYRLLITGHSDALGEKLHNQELSLARARKVGLYLQRMGLAPKRIQLEADGSNNPLFDGIEPQVRLVNRRVSIELIETVRSPQIIAE